MEGELWASSKIFSAARSAKPEKRYYAFKVKCNRCGEVIEGRVDLDNDLSLEYEGDRTVYLVRKGLIGNNRCFQQIEVEMKFTSARTVDRATSTGWKVCRIDNATMDNRRLSMVHVHRQKR